MINKKLLPLVVTHKKLTSLIYSGNGPVSTSVSFSTTEEFYVRVSCSSIVTPTTVTITGVLNGSTDSEVLTLPTGAKQVQSFKKWNSVSSIACAGTVTAIVIGAVNAGGQPVLVTQTITSTMKGRLRAARLPNIVESPAGQQLLERWYFYTNDYAGILPSDILTIDSINYEVESIEKVYDGTSRVHHGRLFLKRFN